MQREDFEAINFEDEEIPAEVIKIKDGRRITVAKGDQMEMGSFKVVEDPKGDYLIKVIEPVKSDGDAESHYQFQKFGFPTFEPWNHKCSIVGKVEDGEVKGYDKKPEKGSPVLDKLDGDIFDYTEPYFGELATDDIQVGIPQEAINLHFSIFGGSGKGKTNTACVIISQLHGFQQAVPIVIENKNSLVDDLIKHYYSKSDNDEYQVLTANEANYENFKDYGVPSNQIRKLLIDPNDLDLDTFRLLVRNFDRESTYANVIQDYYYEHRQDNWFDTLEDEIEDGELDVAEATEDAIRRRVNSVRRKSFIADRDEDGIEIFDVAKHTVNEEEALIVDVSSAGDRVMKAVGMLVANKLASVCDRRRVESDNMDDEVPFILAMDEAHNWIGKGEDTEHIFRRFIKEQRQNKLGFLFITQEGSNLDTPFFNNVGTIITHTMKGDEASHVASNMSTDTEKGEIETLEKGTAIVEDSTEHSKVDASLKVEVFGAFEDWVWNAELYECSDCGEKKALNELRQPRETPKCKSCNTTAEDFVEQQV